MYLRFVVFIVWGKDVIEIMGLFFWILIYKGVGLRLNIWKNTGLERELERGLCLIYFREYCLVLKF